MNAYQINKGVGKSVEFKGIRAQYVLYLVVGVVCSFVLFFLSSLLFGQWLAVAVGIGAGLLSFALVYFLNARFGEHGLMHFMAGRCVPVHLSNSQRIYRIVPKCG